MSGRDILPLFPSRANFVLMKQRIAAATTGLSLLKRKRDALDLHLRQILNELKRNREQIESVMQEAIFSMAKAKFLAIDLKPATIHQPTKADAYVQFKNNKIVGMNVPSLELMLKPSTSLPFTGLSGGGQQVEVVRSHFQEALKILIALASLEYNARVVGEAVKLNNRRVNGLEYVVLPRYHNTMTYIRDELDEFEREDFYRLKRSQAKQNKKKSQFTAEMDKRSESETQLVAAMDMDISDWITKVSDIKQMGLKGDPSVAVTRKTIVNLKGNTVVLVPQDKMKPVIVGGGGGSTRKPQRPRATADDEKKIKSKHVVVAAPSPSSSSETSMSSEST